MEHTSAEHNNVVVVHLNGELHESTYGILRDLLDDSPEEAKRYVIDMTGVDHIQPAGWGALLVANRELRDRGGRLRLASMKDPLRDMFRRLRLSDEIDLHGTVDQALAVFRVEEFPAADSFGKWLTSKIKKVRSVSVPTLGITFSLTSAVTAIGRVSTWAWLEVWFLPIVFVSQLVIVFLLLWTMPRPPSNTEISDRASKSAEQFHEAWHTIWLFWVILYAVLAVSSLLRALTLDTPTEWWHIELYWQPLVNALNNSSTSAFFVAYLVVSKETVYDNRASHHLPWRRAFAPVIVVFLAECALVILAQHFGVLDEASKGHMTRRILVGFQWGSGILAGVSMALLVGRLDSKFIDASAWVLGTLYFYALIQPTWGGFNDEEALRKVFISLALALKCLFFLFVYWLYESGTLLFYLERVGRVYRSGKRLRTAFLRRFWAAAESSESS